MKRRHAIAIMVTSSLALAASAAGIAQSAPAPGGGLQVLDFKPGFDDLMTMLVQPRHIKLYAAGKQGNWELAGFQLNELRASFRRIGQTLPTYRTYPINSVGRLDHCAEDAGHGRGDQGARPGQVRHRLWRADGGVQRLPSGDGARVLW